MTRTGRSSVQAPRQEAPRSREELSEQVDSRIRGDLRGDAPRRVCIDDLEHLSGRNYQTSQHGCLRAYGATGGVNPLRLRARSLPSSLRGILRRVPRAVLLIADIGGYTRFMKVHRINLAHAQFVVGRLLEALIDGTGRRLKLAKLEGDAAFFYATADAGVGELTKTIADIRGAFLRRREELTIDRLCSCDGCTQAGELKLKFVAHVGEIAFQKVKRHTELAGVDVILVHRLLKNSVPVPEYLLMSEEVHGHLPERLQSQSVAVQEELEGIGATRAHYLEIGALNAEATPARAPSLLRKLTAWLRMTWRSLPYMLGAKKACDNFRNLGDIGERS